MTISKISFSNRAYSEKWYKNMRRQNPAHFDILNAIIEEIEIKDGGDIEKEAFYKRRPDIANRIADLHFDILPSRGQMLKHNGNGIRHAKYAPSKSIAVVWEKIGDVIYITFDDHAPIRYHRAISHLRQIKLGRELPPKRARNGGYFLRRLRKFWKTRFHVNLKGFDPKRKYYE